MLKVVQNQTQSHFIFFSLNVAFWAYAEAFFYERNWAHKLTDPAPDPEQCWIASNYGYRYLFCQIFSF